MESILTGHFVPRLKHLLDPIWHRLSGRSRNLINDLRVLKQMLEYLMSTDCVTFNWFLETFLAANAPAPTKTSLAGSTEKSAWIFMDAADTIFSVFFLIWVALKIILDISWQGSEFLKNPLLLHLSLILSLGFLMVWS